MLIIPGNHHVADFVVHWRSQIAGDLADLRTASKACADEVVALRERYRASYAAQQTALAEAMTGLRLMPRLS